MLKRWRDSVFSAEEVNTGRQTEADIAKGILVLCLAVVHITIECTDDAGLCFGLPYFFDSVLGGPLGAPMFLFCMGIGLIYTASNSPRDIAGRGLHILGTGIVLNICRYLLPLLAGFFLSGNSEYLAPLPYLFFGNDLLQFAGLFMLLYALIKKATDSDGILLLIAFALSCLSTLLGGVDFGRVSLNMLFSHLLPVEDAGEMIVSDFPLITWFLVPVSGCLFGRVLRRVKNKDRFFLPVFLLTLFITVLYFTVNISRRAGMFGEGQNCYYHMATDDTLAAVIAAVCLLGFWHFTGKVFPRWLLALLRCASRNITRVYCIHWVFVVWITDVLFPLFFGSSERPMQEVFLVSAVVTAASLALAELWRRKLRERFFGRFKHAASA